MRSLKFCSRCVLDGSARELVLDEQGVCNFCHQAQRALAEIEAEKPNLEKKIARIKKDGRDKQYDVLIGISGGADSSTALYEAVKLGLRPLAYSVDNGWQTDKSQANIMKMVEGLKVPYYRYTIDLERFRELQTAFLKAGQINVEIPTDHILLATTYEMASQYGIKWVLSGGNVSTESIMPASWGYQPRDLVHIKSVYKWATGKKLEGLPLCGIWKWNWYHWVKGIRTFYLLDYLRYSRAEAIKVLQENFDWEDYGEKHEESTFTWWFQSFYLFEKFSIDKRKAHYSSLINSGQMTRSEALKKLTERPVFPNLGIEKKVMEYKKQPHTNFETDERLWRFLTTLTRPLRKLSRK